MKNIDSMKGMQEELNISTKPPGRLSNGSTLGVRAFGRHPNMTGFWNSGKRDLDYVLSLMSRMLFFLKILLSENYTDSGISRLPS